MIFRGIIVIKIVEFFEYKKTKSFTLECEYSYLSQLEYILKEQNIEISSKEFEKEVKINIDISEKDFEILEKKLSRDVKIF